jgi:hypothetical protein
VILIVADMGPINDLIQIGHVDVLACRCAKSPTRNPRHFSESKISRAQAGLPDDRSRSADGGLTPWVRDDDDSAVGIAEFAVAATLGIRAQRGHE